MEQKELLTLILVQKKQKIYFQKTQKEIQIF